VGLLLGGLATSWIRGELRIRATGELLARLDTALSAYHLAVGYWPAEARPATQQAYPASQRQHLQSEERSASSALQRAAEWILAALPSVPESKAVLDGVPRSFRGEPEATGAEGSSPPGPVLVDAWRHRLGCLTTDSPAERDRRAVAANGGRPIFISAGPDGIFGSQSVACAADDIFIQPDPRQTTWPAP
jgi:hypothetical protein